MHVLNSGMYRRFLTSSHEPDPAAPGVLQKNKQATHPLLPLFVGPTALIAVPSCDTSVVKALIKICKQSNEKLILLGAKIEQQIMDLDGINRVKDLPSKHELQGQLAGVLTVLGGAGLVRTLESSPSMLYLTLQAREGDMKGPEVEEGGN